MFVGAKYDMYVILEVFSTQKFNAVIFLVIIPAKVRCRGIVFRRTLC